MTEVQLELPLDGAKATDIYTDEEHATAEMMAAVFKKDMAIKKSFQGRRNRNVWNRMNSPKKASALEAGTSFLTAFFKRNIHLPVVELEETEEKSS